MNETASTYRNITYRLVLGSQGKVKKLVYLIGDAVLLLYLIAIPQTIAQQIERSTTESDWYGLKALYAATDGENWKINSNWDVNREYPPSPDSLAEWYGITLSDGRVTELDLSDNGLTGVLPVELGYLSNLQVLDLQENELSGSVGSWIKKFTAIVKLRLQKNRLTGPIPDELGSLSHLEYLNLRGNQLEGVVPESLEKLQKLRGLWLHANQLSGPIPQGIVELPNLGWLWLGENPDLSGVITVTDPEQMTSTDFYLGETSLCIDSTDVAVDEGTERAQTVSEYACLLAAEWDALEKLYGTTGGDNWIDRTGWDFESRPKAEAVGQWYGISVEDGHIRTLQLDLNHLDGFLPPELGSLTKLEVLRMDGNPLRGAIPAELFSLENMKVFSASETELCIPTTTAAQLWLEETPTVIGLENCSDREAAPPSFSSDSDQGREVILPLWLVVGFGLLGVLGAGAALITVFTKTRRSKEPEQELIEIDRNADQLMAIEQRLEVLMDATDSISNLTQQYLNQSDIAKDFSSALTSLRNALDERDQEIKRLKRGYDNAVFRKFIARFIRVDQAVQYFIQHTESSSTQLESIHSLLEDALQECDVQPFSPEIGSDYRSAFGVAEYPKILTTITREDDCRIAEILEPGYIMQGGKEKEVLIPARVAIYRFKLEK